MIGVRLFVLWNQNLKNRTIDWILECSVNEPMLECTRRKPKLCFVFAPISLLRSPPHSLSLSYSSVLTAASIQSACVSHPNPVCPKCICRGPAIRAKSKTMWHNHKRNVVVVVWLKFKSKNQLCSNLWWSNGTGSNEKKRETTTIRSVVEMGAHQSASLSRFNDPPLTMKRSASVRCFTFAPIVLAHHCAKHHSWLAESGAI